MRKGVKISLWVALCFILTGMITIAVGGSMLGFDFTKMDTVTYIERNESVEDDFTEIEIDCDSVDVTVLSSPDGECRVESKLNRDFGYSMTVENGKLRIEYEADAWYRHLYIHYVRTHITLYLPKEQYDSLNLKLQSGDITVRSLQFEKTEIDNCSGDVNVKGCTGGSFDIETTSGDVMLQDIKASGMLSARTTSGDLGAINLMAQSVSLTVGSGDVEMNEVAAEEDMTLKTTSGDITFMYVDAKTLDVKTTSGDVEGSLLSGKNFDAKATSGDVHVPRSDYSAGVCKVRTTSGDIDIKVIS